MGSNITLSSIGKAISQFLHRFHIMLFTLTVLVGFAAIIYLLNGTINAATNTSNIEVTPVRKFDQATIKSLQQNKLTNELNQNTNSYKERNPFY